MTRRRNTPAKLPPGVRQRERADGTLRLWWAPSKAARDAGMTPVDLDPDRMTWSMREAERLNREAAKPQGAARRRSDRTIQTLIDTYKRSPRWQDLRPATQRDYTGAFNIIARKWGADQVTDFDKPLVYTWYEAMFTERGQSQARAVIRKLSLLFSYAEKIGWRAENSNPCFGLDMRTPDRRKRHGDWPEIDALLTASGACGLPSVALAVLLSIYHGQRQTDCITAKAADFTTDDSSTGQPVIYWTFTRSKRGNAGAVQIHPDVIATLTVALQQAQAAGRDGLMVDELSGKPYDTELFQRRWQKVRAQAVKDAPEDLATSLATLQFRDLRRTFGILARRAGAAKADVGDVLGNSMATDPVLAQIYTPAEIENASRAVRMIRRPGDTSPDSDTAPEGLEQIHASATPMRAALEDIVRQFPTHPAAEIARAALAKQAEIDLA